MKKICVITGTRAEYGILKPVLCAIQDSEKLELQLIVTGMHLMPEYGETWKRIEEDGFRIDAKVPCDKDDTNEGTAKAISQVISGVADALSRLKPDVFFVPCDRFEMMGSAIAGFYTRQCVAHLHGGERSATFDDSARHAISKLSHIHFCSTKKSGERLEKLGEDKDRIHVVGAPALDTILNANLASKTELEKRFGFDFKGVLVVIQHPLDAENAGNEMAYTLDAIKRLKKDTIIMYPNNDAGGKKIIEKIKEVQELPFVRTFKSLKFEEYLSLLKHASVMVGNSSSAIIEAPAFGTPVVNIGDRQKNRERAASTIDVPYDTDKIVEAIDTAIGKTDKAESIYGDGTASKKIIKVLEEIDINKDLLNKQITY